MKDKDAAPVSCSYIAPGDIDPRPEILKRIKEQLGNSGSIIAYNAIFEKTVLRQAIEAYPEYKDWITDLEERFVDLLVPFRGFMYYHPNQSGSASIKQVLPALTGLKYDELEISDGDTASIEYSRVVFGKNVQIDERKRVFAALEKYCNLDTKGMIDMVEALRKIVKNA